MKLWNKINCYFGNHKYHWNDTYVTLINEDVCRIEQNCYYCGYCNCFLTHYFKEGNVNE